MEIQTIDVKNVCRCCILLTSDLELVFDMIYENELFSKILFDVGKIEIAKDDIFSTAICQNCKIAAINAYKFQRMCMESDKSLRILIGSFSNESSQEDPGVIKDEYQQTQSDNILIDDMKIVETDGLEFEATEENYIENESDSDIENNSTSVTTEITEIYECSNCSKTFKSNTKLENHLRKCQQQLNDVIVGGNSNEEEESEEEEDEKQGYSCTECSKVFKKKSLLSRHTRSAHNPNKKPHECSQCNKKFPSNVALMRHGVMHSDLVERSKLNRDASQEFTCVICGRTFKTHDNLTTHLKGHKNKSRENDDEYVCKLCNDVFSTFSDILRHSKNHIENATHQCAICNKLFAVGDELIDHFLRHKGMKPHECPICQKSFLKLHKLNVHLRTHSEEK